MANRQKCSMIVVVKADGYGHGAIPTAIFLADKIGADAFAVATLEVRYNLARCGSSLSVNQKDLTELIASCLPWNTW